MKVICFDLEGPLSPQDNAYEVMGLIPEGDKIFEVISYYDDLLTLEGRVDYEPGDTLKLIVPFLIYHGISEREIKKVSDRAILVKGARELIAELKKRNWKIYIVSTSYAQHAHNIAEKVGISKRAVKCTHLPPICSRKSLGAKEISLLKRTEEHILRLYGEDLVRRAEAIRSYLDRFFGKNLKKTNLDWILKFTVMGGRRKAQALERISRTNGIFLEDLIVVGDSITDLQMLKIVDSAGGVAIVFNGNEYALRAGTLGVASTNLLDILPVVETWEKKGRKGIKETIETKFWNSEMSSYHWLVGRKDFAPVIEVHKRFRALVRGEAAKLG